MKKGKQRIASLFFVLGYLISLFSDVFPVSAQAACPGPGTLVKVVDGAKLNVRPNPGGSIPNNAPVDLLTGSSSSPKYFVYEERTISGTSFLRIENGDKDGWILSAFLELTCGTLVPPATLTPTRTFTPTRTPTSATPTRLPSSTSGPSPTPTGTPSVSRITVFEMSDGSIVINGYCVQACEWSFNMENLP